jgi:hypothetical protein
MASAARNMARNGALQGCRVITVSAGVGARGPRGRRVRRRHRKGIEFAQAASGCEPEAIMREEGHL